MTTTAAWRAADPAVPGQAAPGAPRRRELAAFLRSRRERITPADVGLPPGLRRRTPGLRREEVAQLAGVGVTWYTWLEQGRRINASVQVLDAIARTLRLDAAERAHLYRLADVPEVPRPAGCAGLEPAVRTILDHLDPLPACVYNGRYDLLAWNSSYAALFPTLVSARPAERNAIWHVFTCTLCHECVQSPETEYPWMVATLRAAFAGHVGEPAWEEFVAALRAASPAFDRMWREHQVAGPGSRTKTFRHPVAGLVRTSTTSMALSGAPEARMVVYTPLDQDSRDKMAWLRDQAGTVAR
ncbi:transcriptional regulator [Sphaerisporangium rufum]|uniref:Transcriptional regulator n=1 Tax=Sphaerisporangium rufum TaxID=1381558 RepID=A0A919R8C0_9ACTN|nr:helix-turn-helix transcriptional regulator [Sphaerisporangium rufum]GII81093.1 transcriptional regulator [Sphaerisporangium rufum]